MTNADLTDTVLEHLSDIANLEIPNCSVAGFVGFEAMGFPTSHMINSSLILNYL